MDVPRYVTDREEKLVSIERLASVSGSKAPRKKRSTRELERRLKASWGRSIVKFHRRLILGSMASLLAVPFALSVDPAGAADKIKIGFLLKTMQEERYQRDKADFLAKAKALGADVIFDSANNDEQTQLAAFENMLSQGAQIIVLQPVNTGTAGSMVTSAHKANVKVVGYDAMLVNGPLDAMVMQDSWAVGKLQAEAMVAWLKAKNGSVKGNIALIRGQPGDSNANALSSGVLEVLKANPDLRLVADQSHEGWLPDKAMATTENLLTKLATRSTPSFATTAAWHAASSRPATPRAGPARTRFSSRGPTPTSSTSNLSRKARKPRKSGKRLPRSPKRRLKRR